MPPPQAPGNPNAALHRASVSPGPRGTSQRPLTTFFLPGKVQNNLGAGSGYWRRPRAAGLYAWHCLREKPRRRGPQEDGDGAGGAGRAGLRPRPGRASSSRLAAGARGGWRRPGCRPGVGARDGTGEKESPATEQGGGGRAGGGTCCSGPCAPGRPSLFSSWRSRHRRAAPRRIHARPLRTDGAVSGPRPGPAARPPGARSTKGRGRYLCPCAPGIRLPPAGSAGSSAPSSGPPAPARALRDGGGRCPACFGRLRSPPAPCARRPHCPDSRGLRERSAATLRFGPSN